MPALSFTWLTVVPTGHTSESFFSDIGHTKSSFLYSILSFRFLRMESDTVSPKFLEVHLVSSSSYLGGSFLGEWGFSKNLLLTFISKSNPFIAFSWAVVIRII